MSRKALAAGVIAAVAIGATVVSILPIFAQDDVLVLRPTADMTITQVPQDGDTNVKTTLASCPDLCDGNPHGRRDAVLQFAVDRLPAGATRIKATLKVYAWHDFSARILASTIPGVAAAAAGGLSTASTMRAIDRVTRGFNEFDVSDGVAGNGTYTFALSQLALDTRIYWASRENANESLRPELVLSYEVPGTAPTPEQTVTPTPTTTTERAAAPTPTRVPTTPEATPSRTPTSAPPPEPTSPPGWRLVWSDEFNGASIDRSKWNLRSNEGRDIDKGCNTDSPRNTFVGEGVLTLRALRQTSVCSSQTRQFTQSYLDTIGKHSWTYGRFEMRAKSPNRPGSSTGLWPAFWLRPEDGGNGEIDVTELPGGRDWYGKSTAAIFYNYAPTKQDTRIALPGGGYPGDGFHTYATEWDATSLRWYLDGKLVWTRNRATTPWFDQVFHKPYNLRLNFQVGGWLGDPDSSTAFPADFVVDYVRVYQR